MSQLSSEDFDFLRRLLLREGGMVLDDGKQYLVSTRLDPVARKHQLDGLTGLVGRLRQDDDSVLADVVDAMTVNETSFFRDPDMWLSLSKHLLPEILDRRSSLKKLSVWVAASSSGQEVYTLIMLLSEYLGDEMDKWHIQVLATDLSREMVNRTQEGFYSNLEVSRGLSRARRDQFMSATNGGYQMNENLRALVRTSISNLTAPDIGVRGSYDLVLLRNVLIYFTPQTRQGVLVQVAEHLSSRGRLLLGASESALGVPDNFVQHRYGTFVGYSVTPDRPSTTVRDRASAAPSTTGTAKDGGQVCSPVDDGQSLSKPKPKMTALEELRALRKEYQQ